MNGRPMHDVEQGLSRRINPAQGGSRRPIITNWKWMFPVLALLAGVLIFPLPTQPKTAAASVTYSQLLNMLAAGHVQAITIEPGVGIEGRWKGADAVRFSTAYPIQEIDALVVRAERAGVAVDLRDPAASARTTRYVIYTVEALLVIGILLMLYAGLRSQGI